MKSLVVPLAAIPRALLRRPTNSRVLLRNGLSRVRLENVGIATASKMPMIAMPIRISMSVKPRPSWEGSWRQRSGSTKVRHVGKRSLTLHTAPVNKAAERIAVQMNGAEKPDSQDSGRHKHFDQGEAATMLLFRFDYHFCLTRAMVWGM